MRLFASAAKGTEVVVRDELRRARFRKVRADRGGVHFEGPLEEGFRACLELRTAMRVLAEISSWDAEDEESLYEGAREAPVEGLLTAEHTLAIRAHCRSSFLTHSQFVAQKVKDGIVDAQRERGGARSSVDRDEPDVLLFLHLVRDRATLYADLSGEPLHRRGYRQEAREAPLKETLAAAILMLAGWDGKRPLVDPMCGSGTIPIEADLLARDVAPGLLRRFGFERWSGHGEQEQRALEGLREAARARARSKGPPILGSDVDPEAILLARKASRLAGVHVRFERRAVEEIAPTDPPALVVVNPPYGERLEGGPDLYKRIGGAFTRLSGHTIAVLAGSPEIPRHIPMRPSRSVELWNGPIECRLLVYEPR